MRSCSYHRKFITGGLHTDPKCQHVTHVWVHGKQRARIENKPLQSWRHDSWSRGKQGCCMTVLPKAHGCKSAIVYEIIGMVQRRKSNAPGRRDYEALEEGHEQGLACYGRPIGATATPVKCVLLQRNCAALHDTTKAHNHSTTPHAAIQTPAHTHTALAQPS